MREEESLFNFYICVLKLDKTERERKKEICHFYYFDLITCSCTYRLTRIYKRNKIILTYQKLVVAQINTVYMKIFHFHHMSYKLFDHAFFQNFEISNALLSLFVDDPIGDNTIVTDRNYSTGIEVNERNITEEKINSNNMKSGRTNGGPLRKVIR